MAKVVKLNDFAKELKNYTGLKSKQIKAATAAGIAKSIPGLVEKSPVDQGFYAQSWNMSDTEVSILLGNFAPHSPIIEDGARPFKPPITPLLAWAKRVLQDASQPPEYSPAVMALAFGTQRKIMERGMLPKKILENELPQIIANIKEELENAEQA